MTAERRTEGTQWESTPRTLLMVAGAALSTIVALYWIGMPLVVNAVATRIPHSALQTIGDQTLASLDRDLFRPSTVPPSRRESIARSFERLTLASELDAHVRVEFRRSDEIGANAMALPSGTLVVTDDLVALAKDDDDVVAVLAHEVGHFADRHGVKAVVQSAFLRSLIALIAGDANGLAAAAPAALLNARYSRDLERDADAYAMRLLSDHQISPARLADMLERMEMAHAEAGRTAGGRALQYLSTHPTTEERLETLRGGPLGSP